MQIAREVATASRGGLEVLPYSFSLLVFCNANSNYKIAYSYVVFIDCYCSWRSQFLLWRLMDICYWLREAYCVSTQVIHHTPRA
jgi:hypothetical protein